MRDQTKTVKKTAEKGVWRRVWTYIARYRFLLILSLLLSALSAVGMLFVPRLIGSAIDLALGPGAVDLPGIGKILLRAGAIVLFAGLTLWLMNLLCNRIVYAVLSDVRTDAFRRIQILPLSYLDAHPVGEIVSRVITDADQFSEGLLLSFTQLFSGVVTILGTLIFMWTIHPLMTLVVVVLTPLSLFAARFIARRTHLMFAAQSTLRGEQTACISETVGHQKVIQAFSHTEESQATFDEINERLGACSLRAIFYSSLVNPCTRFVNSIVYAAVAFTGAMILLNEPAALTVGALTCFLSYAGQYAKPFNDISGVVAELQNATACAGRLLDLISVEPQVPDAPDALTLTDPEGEVAFENVYFSYTPDRKLIEDLSLHVEPGQRVAIVGPTGCGKTTLINLLMRFYDPVSGQILVDGNGTGKITRKSLRAHFGMVLQETWLTNATVRDNIAMGRPDATVEEVRAAAIAAHADHFIRRLPNGYETVLGEDGGSLSAGQKQLLCIARIFLCLPPMLILDEATSSIDVRTEQQVQRAFAELMRGRTSFIVAHRLSTVRTADLILVMRDGQVVEQGNHEELIAREGFYAQLYRSQFEE